MSSMGTCLGVLNSGPLMFQGQGGLGVDILFLGVPGVGPRSTMKIKGILKST